MAGANGNGSAGGRPPEGGEDATLYVIPGSHACRTAMLMLDHKGVSYRRVELITGIHPFVVRMLGFAGHRDPIRTVDGRTHAMLAVLDRAGTVPALRYGAERVQGNIPIARFLDGLRPDPPLFPSGEEREAVVEAERWGDEVLQMVARRLVLSAGARGLGELRGRGGEGRLGALLAGNEPMRIFSSRTAAFMFRAGRSGEARLLAELPAMLDRIDGWIAAGALDGPQLNAADFMIASSLALLAYRRDVAADIAARPAGHLLDRILPDPSPVGS
jgi:glutathione S-transferase